MATAKTIDPFALLDDEDFEQWESIVQGLGTKIAWGTGVGKTELFVGIYVGTETVEFDEPKGDRQDMSGDAALFERRDGRYFCWVTFQIQKCITSGALQPGDACRIEYKGSVDTGKGNRVHELDIKVKRPTS